MSQIGPIPVRFSPEIVRRLERAAVATGLGTKTAIVKLCVANFLDYFEKHGMEGLALNWKDMLRETDGRTHRYRDIHVVAQQSVVNGNMNVHSGLKVAESAGEYGRRTRRKVKQEAKKP